VTPNKKELGLGFKRDAKAVADALEALGVEDAMCLKVRADLGLGEQGAGVETSGRGPWAVPSGRAKHARR
jgi:hypothetical protein